ncbi:MAG: hypothetical protein ACRDRO_20120 [Pseudonocardiaceae bacterium]
MVRITDEEFARVGDKQAAVMMAMGAASVCWDPTPTTGVFDSERAADVADDLIRYLAVPAGVSKEEAAWLLTLINASVPADPGSSTDWEGLGRDHARKILQRVIDAGSPAPVDLVGSNR